MYLGDYGFGSTVFFKFTTIASTGTATALSSAGITVYREGSTVQNTTGLTLTSTFDGITGLNHVIVEMSSTGFYSSGGTFTAVISSGAGAEDLSGYVIAHWSLVDRYSQVTTAVSISTGSAIDSVTNVNSTVDANVRQWLGTAPSTLGTNSHVRVSSTGSFLNLGTTADVNVAQWRGTVPSTLGTNSHVRISSTADILSVTNINSTVDSHVRAVGGSTLAAENVRYTMQVIGRGVVGVGSSSTAIVLSSFTPSLVVADQVKGRIVTFDSTTVTTSLRGQATDITGNSTDTINVTALTVAPSSEDEFSVT